MANEYKTKLRNELKKRRLLLSEKERQLKSQLICSKLISYMDWSKIQSLLVYESILSLAEVDIEQFTKLLTTNYDIKIYTPRRQAGQWQIVEISSGLAEHSPKFDAAIIPVLGFSEQLHRLGYGGGYYDKLLKDEVNTLKIGVSFDFAKVNNLPVEEHDTKMDLIISEKKIYS